MNKQRLQELFWKYVDNDLTTEEEQEFFMLMAQPWAAEEAGRLTTSLWEQRYQQEVFAPDVQSHQRIKNILGKVQPKRTNILRYWPAAAAAVLLLSGAALWLNRSNTLNEPTLYTFSAGPGERKVVTMPDQTIVHLNSGSTISYNDAYNRKHREVTLDGEAFFEVAENAQQPFKVHHAQLTTEVLGTSFNISAFPQAPAMRVTVATGAVRVSGESTRNPVLTAGQELIYNKQSHTATVLKPAHAGDAYAWKDGVLSFDGQRLADISIVLERWYNVNIHLENKGLENCRFTGSFERLPVDKVLELLSRHSDFTYRISGKDIYISGVACD
ncbi:FecR domain-containing protein [uncultured Chitinophaga sp.]|uniref:FecR family protein n=1 Tax=uncultured Chitinophaga sp. TaxID=339340 RepID=UPI0025D4D6A4|nr:FecR domain-containing protein [uncultured Chitinophaga sp.]